jgi:hypothetical protein
MSTSTEKQSFDPARRRLCPDGACIGLLDESGRCKECGMVAGARAAEPAATPAVDDMPGDDFGAEGAAGDDGGGDAPLDAAPADGTSFDPSRRLCPDGACLGVLGSDGRCSVCGRTAEG